MNLLTMAEQRGLQLTG